MARTEVDHGLFQMAGAIQSLGVISPRRREARSKHYKPSARRTKAAKICQSKHETLNRQCSDANESRAVAVRQPCLAKSIHIAPKRSTFSMTTPLAIYIKEEIEIHRSAIAKIEDRRPDLKAARVRAAPTTKMHVKSSYCERR